MKTRTPDLTEPEEEAAPLELFLLEDCEAPLTVAYNGRSIELQIRPGIFTLAYFDTLAGKSIAAALVEAVASWNVARAVDGTPQVVPLEEAAITEAVSLPLQRHLWEAIVEAVRPN